MCSFYPLPCPRPPSSSHLRYPLHHIAVARLSLRSIYVSLFLLRYCLPSITAAMAMVFGGMKQVQETAGPVQPPGGGIDSGDKSRPFVQDAVPVGDGMEGGSAPPRPAAVTNGAGEGAVQDDGGLVSRARAGGSMGLCEVALGLVALRC